MGKFGNTIQLEIGSENVEHHQPNAGVAVCQLENISVTQDGENGGQHKEEDHGDQMLAAADGLQPLIEKGQEGEHERVGVEVPVFALDQGKSRLEPVIRLNGFGGEDGKEQGG